MTIGKVYGQREEGVHDMQRWLDAICEVVESGVGCSLVPGVHTIRSSLWIREVALLGG